MLQRVKHFSIFTPWTSSELVLTMRLKTLTARLENPVYTSSPNTKAEMFHHHTPAKLSVVASCFLGCFFYTRRGKINS